MSKLVRGAAGGSHAGRRRDRRLRRRPTRREVLLIALPVVAVMVASTVLTGSPAGFRWSSDEVRADDGCHGSVKTLTVAASPEIAGAVGEIAHVAMRSRRGSAAACSIRVSASRADQVLSRWNTDSGDRPDVWIPDSSIWVAKARERGVPAASSASIATSPVVLSASSHVAATLRPQAGQDSLDRLMDSRSSRRPVTLGVPDPRRSAESTGVLVALRAAVAARPDARAALTWALRAGPSDPQTPVDDASAGLADHPDTALPTSEQQVYLHGLRAGTPASSAVYLGPAAMQLDYPYVILGPRQAGAARTFLSVLMGTPARTVLARDGFRDSTGTARGPLADAPTIDADFHVRSAPPSIATVDAVNEMWAVANEPSRLLTVLDVSGSMGTVVADTGGATRLDLTKRAVTRALTLYDQRSEIGLWTFATDLGRRTDYREEVPVGPLGVPGDKSSGRTRLLRAVAAAQPIQGGGTGLYDTALAAVRTVRAGWDPNRVNSVLLLSDGRNDDDGMSLGALLDRLTREQDPERPVPVTAIAFGPDSDVDALRRISRLTGGSTYVARDPSAIGEIFLDSVGQRLCRPFC